MKFTTSALLLALLYLADATVVPKDGTQTQTFPGAVSQDLPASHKKRDDAQSARVWYATPVIPIPGLHKRADNSCPAGMVAVSCPDKDACCATGTYCFQDTKTGKDGCCKNGQICTSVGGCDVGFYECSAALGGGCCTIGRDCELQGGVTVCVPPSGGSGGGGGGSSGTGTSSAPAPTSTGSCVAGFFLCTEALGGGCCPTGTTCSTANGGTCLKGSTGTCSTGLFKCADNLGGGCCVNGTTCALNASGQGICSNGGAGTSTCASGRYLCSDALGGGCCPLGTTCTLTGCLTGASSTSGPTKSITPVEFTGGPDVETPTPTSTTSPTSSPNAAEKNGVWGGAGVAAVMGIAAALV